MLPLKTETKTPVLCLMGPTASGKTALAIELTQHFPIELISVDSAMVYRGLTIGTAKPEPALLKKIPHRLIDIRDPEETYSAGDFIRDAHKEIVTIQQQGHIPLLVGGTMLYFHALQQGLAELPTQDPDLRKTLQTAGETKGWPKLHEELRHLDPEAAARIHPHDSQRIQRALEVKQLSGQNLSALQQNAPKKASPFLFYNLLLEPNDRSLLHECIKQRFLTMLKEGLITEVETLKQRPQFSEDLPAFRSVGYRQTLDYLAGRLTYEEMTEKAIIATRQLAKRQITWLQRFKNTPSSLFKAEDPTLTLKVRQQLESVLDAYPK